jgi:hypothetical protein
VFSNDISQNSCLGMLEFVLFNDITLENVISKLKKQSNFKIAITINIDL